MEPHQYTESTMVYHSKYVRNSRAIGVMWGILTICFALIVIVVFIEPQWLGDLQRAGYPKGYYGLHSYCHLLAVGKPQKCLGSFGNIDAILNSYFVAASILVCLSMVCVLACICCFLLFFCLKAATVYMICAWLLLVSAICLVVGCVVYPAGWDDIEVRSVCGAGAGKFDSGTCAIRWAYILAIIGIFDALILCTLGFVLARKQAKLLPKGYTMHNGTLTKSEIAMNGYDSMRRGQGSAYGIQPVMTLPHQQDADRYSEYSHRSTHSKPSRSGNKNDFRL